MKKSILLAILSIILSTSALADSRTAKNLSTAQQLGITAGIAQACNVDTEQLKNYELIASRIIVNPTINKAAETAILKEYAQSKLKAYKTQQKSPNLSCREVVGRFYNQDIFKSVVYPDGTVKLFDGTVIKPVRNTR